MGASSTRIPVDPIEGLHLRRVWLIPRLALLVVALGVGARLRRERPRGRGRNGRADAERAQELTTTKRFFAKFFRTMCLRAVRRRLAFFCHCPHLPCSAVRSLPLRADHDGNAKPSLSISINTRPSVPIRR